MLKLNNLDKLHKSKKRIGRGGDLGGTSSRGHKGQKARSGHNKMEAYFEGGQMSITRRLPKRGFYNSFKKDVRTINLRDLEVKFESGEVVNLESLRNKNLVKGRTNFLVKILGLGTLSKQLEVQANFFSKSAAAAIEKAGGKAQVIKE
ncbi:50S ribosomal protein L15 [Candidatus Babeliales bacterium]|nr:50S ribosomal protein L15 [Candidatus Babeliales bacterium]